MRYPPSGALLQDREMHPATGRGRCTEPSSVIVCINSADGFRCKTRRDRQVMGEELPGITTCRSTPSCAQIRAQNRSVGYGSAQRPGDSAATFSAHAATPGVGMARVRTCIGPPGRSSFRNSVVIQRIWIRSETYSRLQTP